MSQDVHPKKKLKSAAFRLPIPEIADRRFYIPFLLALGPIIPGIFLFRFFPDEMATHFNLLGEPNGYAPRVFVVFVLPTLFALVDLLLLLTAHFEEESWRKLGSRDLTLYLWIVPIVSWSVCLMLDLKAINININIRIWTEIIVGTLLILLSALILRLRYNPMHGIRTPWTLDSETNWQMTNRVSAWVFRGIGILAFIDAFFHFIQFNGWFVIIGALIFTPLGVSYYEHRMDMKERRLAREEQAEKTKEQTEEKINGQREKAEKQTEELFSEKVPEEPEASWENPVYFERENPYYYDEQAERELFEQEDAQILRGDDSIFKKEGRVFQDEPDLMNRKDPVREPEDKNPPAQEDDIYRNETDLFKPEDTDIYGEDAQDGEDLFRQESLESGHHSRIHDLY